MNAGMRALSAALTESALVDFMIGEVGEWSAYRFMSKKPNARKWCLDWLRRRP